MKQAVSYVRFSATQQAKGSSVERQSELFDQWLLSHPEYTSSTLKRVDRGLSAYKGKHKAGGLGDLLKAIEDKQLGAGDCIVIEAIDRLSRQEFDEAYEVIRRIVSAGVSIFTIEDNQRYDKASLNSPDIYRLVAKIHAAHEYSNRLSTRIAAAHEAKRKKARAGEKVNAPNRPYWIDQQGNSISDKVKIVLRAIELYEGGAGQLEIIKKLALEFNDPELPKTTRSIKRLLTNEALIGRWDGIQAFDAVISIAKYLELQALVGKRVIPNKAEEKYLLSGLIKCRHCGASYNFRRQKARATKEAPVGSAAYLAKGDIVYANCSAFLKSDRCSNSFTVPYEVAELVFSRTSENAIYSIAAGIALDAMNNKEIGELIAKKSLLEQRLERLSELFLLRGEQSLKDRIASDQLELNSIESKLSRQKQLDQAIAAAPKNLSLDDFEIGTVEQKAFHIATQKAMSELTENIVNFRNELKDFGYVIKAGRPEDESSNGVLEACGSSYSIVRRSQKEQCYLVRAVEPDEQDGHRVLELQARRRRKSN